MKSCFTEIRRIKRGDPVQDSESKIEKEKKATEEFEESLEKEEKALEAITDSLRGTFFALSCMHGTVS